MATQKINLSYVVFDGTSYYCVDFQDMIELKKNDPEIEVVFKNYSLEVCNKKADELNEKAYL